MSPREWRFRIADILEAIERIEGYVKDLDFEDFRSDGKTIDAVVRNFIIMGEAAQNVPENVRNRFPDIPWRLIGDMRNFTVHVYWGVDLATVWRTIMDDLPPLKRMMESVLHSDFK